MVGLYFHSVSASVHIKPENSIQSNACDIDRKYTLTSIKPNAETAHNNGHLNGIVQTRNVQIEGNRFQITAT